MTTPLLEIDTLTKAFGGQPVLTDISLTVAQGEFVALLGPSGCGKTTLLRCLAGFLIPESGHVRIAGKDVTALAPYRRPLNTVFQNYALFPHLNVSDNVAYGPRRQGASRAEAVARAQDALALVGLADFGARFPRELSGGQQQRVALARAIVNKPMLLLLDEPLSALDLKLRKRVQLELKQLQEKLGIAFVFVTHDQEEAMTMADRIVVMNGGRIEQIGRGQDIYRAPRSRFVADFIGDANMLPCVRAADGRMTIAIGNAVFPVDGTPAGNDLAAVLRPEDITLVREQPVGEAALSVTVEKVIHVGSDAIVVMKCGDVPLTCRVRSEALDGSIVSGAQAFATFNPSSLHIVAG
jgi:spermidine/putrescine transport system ATP-binding protein